MFAKKIPLIFTLNIFRFILHVSMKLEETMYVNSVAKSSITNPVSILTFSKLTDQRLPLHAIFAEGCLTHVPWQSHIIEPSIWALGHSRLVDVKYSTKRSLWTNYIHCFIISLFIFSLSHFSVDIVITSHPPNQKYTFIVSVITVEEEGGQRLTWRLYKMNGNELRK